MFSKVPCQRGPYSWFFRVAGQARRRRLFLERLPEDELLSPFQYGGHGQELPQVNTIAARRSSRQEQ